MLLRSTGFARLWFAGTFGVLGTSLTSITLPLIAAQTLQARDTTVTLLVVVGVAPWLLIGLPAGGLVDRWSRTTTLIIFTGLRAVALALLPLAWLGGWLSVPLVLVVAAAAGVATVFATLAEQALVPELVAEPDRREANATNLGGLTVADIAGRSGGGLVTGLLGAPVALLVQTASAVLAVVSLAGLPRRQAPLERRHLVSEVRAGLRFTLCARPLRTLLLTGSLSNLAGGLSGAAYVLFLSRTLGLTPLQVGLLAATMSVGAIFGSLAARRLGDRIGSGRVWRLGLILAGLGGLVVPWAQPGAGLVVAVVGWLLAGAGLALFTIMLLTFQQTYVPGRMLGRTGAVARFFAWGAIAIGGLLATVLVAVVSVRAAMIIAGLLGCCAYLVARASPLGRVARLEDLTPA